MNQINMNRMISDLQRLASQAQAKAPVPPMHDLSVPNAGQSNEIDGFGSMFTKAINEVNNLQKNSARLKKAFEAGEPGVDLPKVMVAAQKASVAFEATLEVRKNLLKAYQEVMSMSV